MDPVLPLDLPPMLARLEDEVPEGEGWVYQPKWDGFRALVFVSGGELEVISRDGKRLLRYFPELGDSLSVLPDGCVADGEVVVVSPSGLQFDSLLQRIHPAASRIRRLAEETPAGFVLFDAPAFDGADRTGLDYDARWAELGTWEGVVHAEGPEAALTRLADEPRAILLTPQSNEVETARAWVDSFEERGLDGVIARRRADGYLPGKRALVKVKAVRTIDCVVGGYRLNKSGDGIGSLLLGLYDDSGNLHYVGHTASFKAAERRRLLEELIPLEGGGSFGGGRTPGGPSRWTGGRDATWVSLRPERVCEVRYDRMMGIRFRHAVRFLRWRPDKPPEQCTFSWS